MEENIITTDSDLAKIFYYFGENSIIQKNYKISNFTYTYIGNNVFIKDNSWLNICSYDSRSIPKIEIKDGCQIGSRFTISVANIGIIERNVIIEPNVYISDCSHNYENIGIPIMLQGVNSVTNKVIIGENSWIGVNATIVGNVNIGKGCIIGAGSYVTEDIPDYSLAGGCPAKILKMFDTKTQEWISINSNEEITKVLENRKKDPLVSICIPTYNRANLLEKCLNSIYSQIGNDSLFEIFISNNNSSDNTEEVINKYLKLYNNLTYNKNVTNIGADKNIALSIEKSKGKYMILHGDDDYFKDNIIYKLLNIINNNKDSSLLFINVLSNRDEILLCNGINEFLQITSIASSFISSIIIRREDFNKINEPFKFIDTCFNQVYLQYSLLLNNPKFTVINNSAFYYEGTNPYGYNFGRVFIKSYLDILYYFKQFGLKDEYIKQDKLQILHTTLLPRYKRFIYNNIDIDIENFELYFEEYYKEEPYYKDAISMFSSIKEFSKKK